MLAGMPLAAAGLFIGHRLHLGISQQGFVRLVGIVLLASGLAPDREQHTCARSPMNIIEQLKKTSQELTDLQHALALLQWDQEVLIPDRAAEDRARQMATLSGVIHRRQVAPGLG
ncbi:MAG: hypothetical protein P8Y63_13640, partial [Deltaproteobacteria bacterium]